MGDSEEHPAAGGSSIRSGQCSGQLFVPSCGGSHGVVPGREVGEASLRDVGQATDRPVCVGQQYPSPSLVQSGLSSRGYRSEFVVTTVDRAVSVCFSLISAVHQDLGQSTGGRGGGDDSQRPRG